MAILGLLNTESDANWRFKNIRRQVFYLYPNGAAPLTGLLSLLQEEDTDDPEFSIFEKRLSTQRTTTKQANAAGPWTANPATETTDGATTDAAAQTWAVGDLRAVRVNDTSIFRAGHVVRIRNVTRASGANVDLFGVVTFIDTPDLKINLRVTTGSGGINVAQSTANNDLEVLIVGSSFTQGASALGTTNDAPYNIPISITNYAQIFRTPFEMTGTALKTGLKYDETGPYKDQAKEASVYHMIELEKAFLFGQAVKEASSSNSLPRFLTGGVLWYLSEWEKADSVYRGGTGAAAITLDTDDDKRIIVNSSGSLNEKTYDGYLERVFRVTNNTANEKLVICGSGFLSIVNQMYKSKSVLNADLPMTETYGMNVVRHLTPFGTLFYKTHPLFSQNPLLRYNALILDVQNLRYRPIQGRDTDLLKNRQNNGDDFRRDEWLSECGMELRFPESHMYLQNVTNYVP